MPKKEEQSGISFKQLFLTFIIIILIVSIGTILYGNYRQHKLYQRGFRLLQEQIAYYIVENYTGVSKVEFSPIFKLGGPPTSPMTMSVVTKIYDNYDNSAIVGGKIGDVGYEVDAYPGTIDIDNYNQSIFLSRSADGKGIDVSNAEHLPKEGKVKVNETDDKIIKWLVDNGKLKGIEKDKKGSPKAEIIYNLEIKEGDWTTWR